jgi:ElaA protein
MEWTLKAFTELSPDELYALLRLRQRVFVLEQKCPYVDCDGADAEALHLWGVDAVARDPRRPGHAHAMVAYARLFGPGIKYEEASIGRIVTAPEARRTGAGRAVVARGLDELMRAFGPGPVKIQAQRYLLAFYESFGFARVSEDYLEDDIWHVDMRRA